MRGEGLGGFVPAPVGCSLREARAGRLLSIRELAGLAGVAPSTIYLIEAGRSTPQPAVTRLIAGALGVDALAITEFRRAIRARGGPQAAGEQAPPSTVDERRPAGDARRLRAALATLQRALDAADPADRAFVLEMIEVLARRLDRERPG